MGSGNGKTAGMSDMAELSLEGDGDLRDMEERALEGSGEGVLRDIDE